MRKIFFLMLVVCGVGCSKETASDKSYLLVDKGNINLSNKVVSDLPSFQIGTNLGWVIGSEAKWLNFLPTSTGSGDKVIKVGYEENVFAEPRYAVINVSATNGDYKKNITVGQLGIDPVLEVNATKTIFDYQVQENNFLNIFSNVEWSLSVDVDWIILNKNFGSNSADVGFFLRKNEMIVSRQAGIKVVNNRTKEVKTIVIEQGRYPTPSPFGIIQPVANETFYINECNPNNHIVSVKWNKSIEATGSLVLYDVYIDNKPNPENVVARGVIDTFYNYNYFSAVPDKYYVKVVAKGSSQYYTTSGVVDFNLSNTEMYTKLSTIAGGNGKGSGANQFNYCSDLFVDDNEVVYVADQGNYRIQKWLKGATTGTTLIGGVQPNRDVPMANAFQPHSVFVNSIGEVYVSDFAYERILKFEPNSLPGSNGTVVVSGSTFLGIFARNNNVIYVCDATNNCIKKIEKTGGGYAVSVVAGVPQTDGSPDLNKFDTPHNLYVDENENIYVADEFNDRIMYWAKGATQGVVVAGGNGKGAGSNQLNKPRSVTLDDCNNLFIVDYGNKRVVKWKVGATSGKVVGTGLTSPHSMIFKKNNSAIYISDDALNLIQKWTK